MRRFPPALLDLVVSRLRVAALLAVAAGAWGGIEYDAALDAYRVTDYPEECPCTPTLLADMDALLGLGKVTRDPESGACHVACSLVLGANDDTDTYFQIGSATAPQETLVVRGNVSVCPYHIQGQNTPDRWWLARQRINRLTIGAERRPEIRAALKFEAAAPGTRFWLTTGEKPEPDGGSSMGRGGQLVVWNGLITARSQERGWGIAGMRLRGDGFVFVNSTLSWVEGMMTYGASIDWRKVIRVEDSLFEHGTTAVVGARQSLLRCRFSQCGTAVLDYGSLEVTLTECVFENNQHNWHLRFPGKKTPLLRCIDCVFGPPLEGNVMLKQETAATRGVRAQGHTMWNAQCRSLRHLMVQVVDKGGQPVTGAAVAVRAEQEGTDIDEERRYHTGPAGCTAGSAGVGAEAILLPEWAHTVPDDAADDPGPTMFSYTVTASYGPRTAALSGIRPDRSWKTVTLQLR